MSVESASKAMLEVDRVTVRFGGLTAVNEVSVRVDEGQIVAVIGPNGAGKTTLFNAIAGVTDVTEGSVRLGGRALVREPSIADRARWVVTSLVTGLALMVFVSGADALWTASVKHNFQSRAADFDVGRALADGLDHLAGKPRLEPHLGTCAVVSQSGKPLGVAPTREAASALRAELLAKEPAVVAEAAANARMNVLAFILGGAFALAGSAAIARQTRRTPAWIASQGIARTFQNIRLFQEMTVLENVLVGMSRHIGSAGEGSLRERTLAVAPLLAPVGLFAAGVAVRFDDPDSTLAALLLVASLVGATAYVARIGRLGAFTPKALQADAAARAKGRELLAFVGLEGKAELTSKNLPYGDQRRLEIARALATEPQLLLLDEPAAGMNPGETVSLMKLIRAIRERGVTVLLIEHHMRVVMGISDRIAVLQYGKKIADGTPDEIRVDPKVIEAYLGKEELG